MITLYLGNMYWVILLPLLGVRFHGDMSRLYDCELSYLLQGSNWTAVLSYVFGQVHASGAGSWEWRCLCLQPDTISSTTLIAPSYLRCSLSPALQSVQTYFNFRSPLSYVLRNDSCTWFWFLNLSSHWAPRTSLGFRMVKCHCGIVFRVRLINLTIERKFDISENKIEAGCRWQ